MSNFVKVRERKDRIYIVSSYILFYFNLYLLILTYILLKLTKTTSQSNVCYILARFCYKVSISMSRETS